MRAPLLCGDKRKPKGTRQLLFLFFGVSFFVVVFFFGGEGPPETNGSTSPYDPPPRASRYSDRLLSPSPGLGSLDRGAGDLEAYQGPLLARAFLMRGVTEPDSDFLGGGGFNSCAA